MAQHQRRAYYLPATLAAASLVALGWAYATTLGDIAWTWSYDPRYSHGYLVPAFALALLWLRRRQLDLAKLQPSILGLGLIGVSMGMRLGGSYFHYPWLDQVSFIGSIAGLVLLSGGRPAWRWAWPAVAFLAFMIPLPHRLSVALMGPMQTFATEVSTFGLQVLGRPALSEGNVILLDDIELGIVEACSGLRMLVVFFALSTAVALLMHKPLWERMLIAVSALPIALVSNVLRITFTGLLYESVGAELGHAIFHDVMGWLMMPIGLAFLGLELWILGRLLLPPRTAPVLAGVDLSLQRVAYSSGTSRTGSGRRAAKSTHLEPTTTPEPMVKA